MKKATRKQAEQHLRLDPKFAEIIDSTTLRRQAKPTDVYTSLLRSIVYQQLSGKVAIVIHRRFLELFPDQAPHPKALCRVQPTKLRAAGLSRQKSQYLQNVASHWIERDLAKTQWRKMDDEAVINELTQIKGVGIWTCQMLLMFTLQRPDILPLGDLGIRNAIVKKYRLRSQGKKLDARIQKIAECWSPHRTLASRYLWSWLDNT